MEEMKTGVFLLIAVPLCLAFSLVTTLASYYVYYNVPNIYDAAITYRGWPLCWVVESVSYWSPPPYRSFFQFQPVNFSLDFVFWAVAFQLPSIIIILVKKPKFAAAKVSN
jgi:hypothetical protein